MKCPKCSYTSFEYLNVCKKCNKDLTLHKDTFGIVAEAHGTINILNFISLESEVIAEPEETKAELESVDENEIDLSNEPVAETESSGFAQLEEISLDQLDEASSKQEKTFSFTEEAQLEVTLDEEVPSSSEEKGPEVKTEIELPEIEESIEAAEAKVEELDNVEISVDEIDVQPDIAKEPEAVASFDETRERTYMGGESDLTLDDFEVLSDVELEKASSQSFPASAVSSKEDSGVISSDEFDLSLDLTDSFESDIKEDQVESIFDVFSQKGDEAEKELLDFSLDSFEVPSENMPEAGILSEKGDKESKSESNSVEVSLGEIDFIPEGIKAKEVIDQIHHVSADKVNKTGDDEKGIELSFENFKLETFSDEKAQDKSEEAKNPSKEDANSDVDISLETFDNLATSDDAHEPIELFDQIDLAEHQKEIETDFLLAKEEKSKEEKKKEEKSKTEKAAPFDEISINLEDLYPDLDSKEPDNS